jgi:NOL1/NOP2/fmu family ribosome biogenesis protein
MHGSTNIKYINATKAVDIQAYKNTKRKLYKTKAAIWFNKCRHMGIKTRGCKYSLELLMMSGVPLETC